MPPAPHARARAAPERPNVVIFVADDLGWADVGFHGGEQIDTPALDRLAREGAELRRFYTAPICSPTRAALMTGRDPMRLGVAYAVIMPWRSNGIHPDEHFMPQSFLAAGYQTAMVGKWHLGHAQQTYHPNARGFEHFYGHLHTGTRSELVPPPGWRAPPDWAGYPIPLEQLQDAPAPGMPPPSALRPLDWMHGENGRLIYDCEPYPLVGGGLCR